MAEYDNKYEPLIGAGRISEATACMLTGYERSTGDRLSWADLPEPGQMIEFKNAIHGLTVYATKNGEEQGGGSILVKQARPGKTDWISASSTPFENRPSGGPLGQITEEITRPAASVPPADPTDPRTAPSYKLMNEMPVFAGDRPGAVPPGEHVITGSEAPSDLARTIHLHARGCAKPVS